MAAVYVWPRLVAAMRQISSGLYRCHISWQFACPLPLPAPISAGYELQGSFGIRFDSSAPWKRVRSTYDLPSSLSIEIAEFPNCLPFSQSHSIQFEYSDRIKRAYATLSCSITAPNKCMPMISAGHSQRSSGSRGAFPITASVRSGTGAPTLGIRRLASVN
jgi:hypothetical protein